MSDILFCINSACVDLAMVALRSLSLKGGIGPLRVHVIHASLKEGEMERLRTASPGSEFSFHHFDKSLLGEAKTTDRYPLEIYFRLFAPIVLPDSVGKILYLDADTVVINPVTDLWNADFRGKLFIACTHTRKTLTGINAVRLGLHPKTGPYPNTGVLMMDLQGLRKDFSAEKITSFINEQGNKLLLPDQDVLMGVYGDRIGVSDYWRFNLSDRMFRLSKLEERRTVEDVARECSIIHYCGRSKPWKSGYRGPLGGFWTDARDELEAFLTKRGGMV